MFGKRPDGRLLGKLDPFDRIIPYIMKERSDSMVMYEDQFDCAAMDEYIRRWRDEGLPMSYMHILIAATVRILAIRPKLNRFVMNGKLYSRDKIWVSFAIHRRLVDEDVETTLKLCFEGTETIQEISKAINDAIEKERAHSESNGTDKVASLLMKIPSFLIKLVINFLMWTDRHNMLPRFVMEASPFHTSFFLTNLKSLGINHIFHHVYNFGTTGLFLAMGKEKTVPLFRSSEFVPVKSLPFGLVADERCCDGLYFAKALRLFRKYLNDPSQLEIALESKVPDTNL
ncbi:MAG: 2-oxo acid dehydrogenase subunit E2 [Firmicutes bacterium]|nr:2-oxo acid dehydrogenase subunit E2 [Bacillota bacterium]